MAKQANSQDDLTDVLVRYNSDLILWVKRVSLDLKPPKPFPPPPNYYNEQLEKLIIIMENYQEELRSLQKP